MLKSFYTDYIRMIESCIAVDNDRVSRLQWTSNCRVVLQIHPRSRRWIVRKTLWKLVAEASSTYPPEHFNLTHLQWFLMIILAL